MIWKYPELNEFRVFRGDFGLNSTKERRKHSKTANFNIAKISQFSAGIVLFQFSYSGYENKYER